jgi:hypothetical protein
MVIVEDPTLVRYVTFLLPPCLLKCRLHYGTCLKEPHAVMCIHEAIQYCIITALKRHPSCTPRRAQDLDAYISGYQGRGKIDRLLFIAAHAPSLTVDALALAEAEIKCSTISTSLYKEVIDKLESAWYVMKHASLAAVLLAQPLPAPARLTTYGCGGSKPPTCHAR